MSMLSNEIELVLKEMLNANGGVLEFSRSAMAERMQCVPSQITYVVSTRFSNQQGYVCESRRGGSGFIRLQRITWDSKAQFLMHVVNALPSHLTQAQALIIIGNIADNELIESKEVNLLAAAISDSVLERVSPLERKALRSDLLRNLLTALLTA